MKRLICKASTVYVGGGYYSLRESGQERSPLISGRGGQRRSEEQTRLIDTIGEVNP